MDPGVVIPAVVGIGFAYGVLPAVGMRAYDARKPHRVTCPETGKPERVHLDVATAVRSLFTDDTPRVTDCSRWPARADCGRECEKSVCVGLDTIDERGRGQ